MEDERWTTKDKLEQFRGVTGLYNNINDNIKVKTSAQRKKQNKDIKNLTTQNKKFREQYEEVLHGDKKNLLPVLNTHPKMHLAFKNLNTQEIEEELKQSIFCKNKELDRLRYKRKKLEEMFLNKKLKLGELQKEAEDTPENYLWEQEIANQIQSVSVKLNAARTNRSVYEKALDILQKDAIRFDEVLDGLRKDLVHQCESIVKAVEIGQSVTEEMNSLQHEYKETEKAVRANMKQRDRVIRNMRVEIDNVRQHVPSGILDSRAGLPSPALRQSTTNLDDDDSEANIQNLMDMHMKREIEVIQDVLNQIKEAAVVHHIHDICPRMEEQKRQRVRLKKQLQENEEQLARMLELHNQLDVMLEVVMYHTMTDEAKNLKEEMIQLRKVLEEENEELKETQAELVSIAKRIVDVRSALLTLNMMLDTVYPAAENYLTDVPSIDSESAPDSPYQTKALVQPNTQALTLMEQLTKKVRWLLDQVGSADAAAMPIVASQFPFESSTSKVGIEDEADNIVSDMLDELEDMDDPSVLTRKEIKATSQRLVDLYDNPRAMFQDDNQPKYKKHKCF